MASGCSQRRSRNSSRKAGNAERSRPCHSSPSVTLSGTSRSPLNLAVRALEHLLQAPLQASAVRHGRGVDQVAGQAGEDPDGGIRNVRKRLCRTK
jgi:hypothetical protein